MYIIILQNPVKKSLDVEKEHHTSKIYSFELVFGKLWWSLKNLHLIKPFSKLPVRIPRGKVEISGGLW